MFTSRYRVEFTRWTPRLLGFRWIMLMSIGLSIVVFNPGCVGRESVTYEGPGAEATASNDFGVRIIRADSEPQNWLTTGRNYQETRFSPLRQINDGNVGQLGLEWFYDLDTDMGQEATPLIVDGIVFTTSAWSKVQAFDAVSGELQWQFDPAVPKATLARACCDAVNRGAAFWDGKVFVGTLDGRLIAIDALSGRQVWSVVTTDQTKKYTITGAPRVVKGRVIIGNAGSEFGVRGYITAYDATSGQQQWRFFTVPGEPGKPDGTASDKVLAEVAGDTWSGDWWNETGGGGGGTVWDSMAYDPEFDLLYIGVGNGAHWNKKYRSPDGLDNLFLGSIVALRPETGEYVWHYQETPGEQWDYTSTQNMILADIAIDGRDRKVIMHAPKNGFFYVIDRADGQLISAKPYVAVNWASGIDAQTQRPIVNPDALYSQTGALWISKPGPFGGHGWSPMSFSLDTGLAYIPVRETQGIFRSDPDFKPIAQGLNVGLDLYLYAMPDDAAELRELKDSLKGYLLAWDPVTQQEIWRARHSGLLNGGVLSTAGNLVFQGDVDGRFNAYDATTGSKRWSFDVGSAISAGPVSYRVGGRQYVTVLAGWGGSGTFLFGPLVWGEDGVRHYKSRVLTFALNGSLKLPVVNRVAQIDTAMPQSFGDEALIDEGHRYYSRSCMGCHGPSAISGSSSMPDLRYSPAIGNPELWKAIVEGGALAQNGMVAFNISYDRRQLESIRAFLVDRAQTRNTIGH